MLTVISIWQLANIFGYLDPFRGWGYPWTQLVAVLFFWLVYLAVTLSLRRYAKSNVKFRYIALSFTLLAISLMFALNIVLDLLPADHFLEARMTQRRLFFTLGSYWLFAISFALTVALISRLRPGG
jgi:hypothetical protein